MRTMYYSVLVFACMAATMAAASNDRQARRIIQQMTSHSTIGGPDYQLCEKEGIMGACLPITICQQQGKFIGYCGNTGTYCCKVVKTCGDRTTSHQGIFRNPSYPGRDSEARVCPFKMDIGKGVCGVRLNFDFFELAAYMSGVCIRDTLTVLGSAVSNYTATPVCGNMTNWATTFPVKEGGHITLAMVLQGIPSYKFSIRITQLQCSKITTFISPTNAGIRNVDAMPYTPTTTPPPTEATETTEAITDMTTEMPTTTMETTDIPITIAGPTDGTEGEPGPTTLKPGKIPVPKHDEVVLTAPYEEEEEEEEEDYLAVEGVDAVPTISAFKRAFELRVNDRCWQYEDESDTGFRVIGGSYTNIQEYPWQVGLVFKNKFFCGGSLIDDRHILTASHCIFGSFSKGLDKLRVTMGDHDLSTRSEANHTVGRVKSVIWNLHYNPHTTKNDIALLELYEPINFGYGISAVRLPSDLDERYAGANATITGWGRFNIKSKRTSPILKEYTSTLVNGTKCVKAWNKYPGISAKLDQHICLDVTIGTPCHGDSGGPLVVCSGNHCTQVGVVSFGFPLCTNVGLPAVFARVTHFKSWIDMNTHPLSVLHV
ncbi:serine proteinase stubble-like [Portunus trituberculatus]|uniref:serine proteinase stubble-like n=1 Tax=Portunus trituberculatus TaxID=210409 RepID=UPI001E1D0D68|nr:serine proteinase stubble-like [Portunus trituberculatus]XP_045138917.1 serine proteinase stubble-like [Portunus trituberculatus]